MAQIDEFLNPKSMITPGAAGALTMLIANTLWVTFAWPQRYTGLILSFMFALIAFVAAAIPKWQRVIYWLLNGLIIFSVAAGANVAGVAASASSASASAAAARTATFYSSAPASVLSQRLATNMVVRSPSVDTSVANDLRHFSAALVTIDTSRTAHMTLHNQEYRLQSFLSSPSYSLDLAGDSILLTPLSTKTAIRITRLEHRSFFTRWTESR